MKLSIYIRGLLAFLLLGLTIGCLSDSGSESGTSIDFSPLDPDSFSCSPLADGDAGGLPSLYGIHGSLYYLNPDQPKYTSVLEYFEFGQNVSNLDLFLNQLFIPTRPFDRGFVTAGGTTIQTEQGNTLYEYFALKLRGRIVSADLPPGPYQLALLSDDGAILSMDFGNGLEPVVDNDGQHPTRLACAPAAVDLSATPIKYEVLYNQGPRYHIALTLMARPWPTDGNVTDSQCGKSGNDMYFDSTQDPPQPQAAYNDMLARGWFPLNPQHFLLPEDKVINPCTVAAPVISNFVISNITSNAVTLSWQTDIASTSQALFRLASSASFDATIEVNSNSTQHTITVTGLSPNTDYRLKAVSKSYSGQSSESAELAVRTRR